MIMPATQFVRPNGRKRKGAVIIKDELQDKVELANEYNLKIELELLTTGEVHTTLSNEHGDYVSVICENKPGITGKAFNQLYETLTREHLEAKDKELKSNVQEE